MDDCNVQVFTSQRWQSMARTTQPLRGFELPTLDLNGPTQLKTKPCVRAVFMISASSWLSGGPSVFIRDCTK